MSSQSEVENKSNSAESRIQDAWDTARRYITVASAAGVDPRRTVWPAKKPQHGQSQHAHALHAHTATIQFRDELHTYRSVTDTANEVWEEVVTEVEVEGDINAVSLSNLDKWHSVYFTEQISRIDSARGEMKEQNDQRVLLPLTACQKLYRQCCDFTRILGLAAEVDTKDNNWQI